MCNRKSKKESRYVTYKAGRLELGQELGLRWESKVLESPKRGVGTWRTRGNQSIKESI
jgi:hypothetical protein